MRLLRCLFDHKNNSPHTQVSELLEHLIEDAHTRMHTCTEENMARRKESSHRVPRFDNRMLAESAEIFSHESLNLNYKEGKNGCRLLHRPRIQVLQGRSETNFTMAKSPWYSISLNALRKPSVSLSSIN